MNWISCGKHRFASLCSAFLAGAVLAASVFAVPAAALAQAPRPPAAPSGAGDADPHSLGVPKDPGVETKPKEKVLLEMLKLKDKKDEPTFNELREKAKGLGASEEELLEADLTFCFRGQLWDRLKDVGARFAAALPKWDLEKAAYLRTAGQPEAMNQLVIAVLAAEKGDMKTFETAIKEAIWLNPEEASFYSQFIQSYRRKARMASITIPMTAKLATSAGKSMTFEEILKGKKVLLVSFWASFSPEAVAGVPEFATLEKELGPQGVAFVGVNIDPSAQAAEQARTENKISFPWLVEEKNRPLYSLLGHTSFPMTALISAEGKVLYIGDPLEDDIGLKEALEKFGVKYKLPTDEPAPEPEK